MSNPSSIASTIASTIASARSFRSACKLGNGNAATPLSYRAQRGRLSFGGAGGSGVKVATDGDIGAPGSAVRAGGLARDLDREAAAAVPSLAQRFADLTAEQQEGFMILCDELTAVKEENEWLWQQLAESQSANMALVKQVRRVGCEGVTRDSLRRSAPHGHTAARQPNNPSI